jgi:hypothetical protein
MQLPSAEGAKFLSPGRRPCEALGEQPSWGTPRRGEVPQPGMKARRALRRWAMVAFDKELRGSSTDSG